MVTYGLDQREVLTLLCFGFLSAFFALLWFAGTGLIVCADSVTRGLVRDHPSMNMKIGTLVPGYVLSANLSL